MKILLTGAAGRLGRHTLYYLTQRGHQVTAVDIVPLALVSPSRAVENGQTKNDGVDTVVCDLTDWRAVEQLFEGSSYDAVIHFGAIPSPLGVDSRVVHNSNVVSHYNVLQTAAAHGVRRIATASSVNAIGLGFTPEGHKVLEKVPITEEEPITCEDPYGLSKAEGELQASAICRFYPDVRIASLRFHMVEPDQATANTHWLWPDVFGWVSLDACASAALLGITSSGWQGHEVFQIVAPTSCYDWSAGDAGTEELLRRYWGDRIVNIHSDWFKGNPRRSAWDCSKAQRLLKWDHDSS